RERRGSRIRPRPGEGEEPAQAAVDRLRAGGPAVRRQRAAGRGPEEEGRGPRLAPERGGAHLDGVAEIPGGSDAAVVQAVTSRRLRLGAPSRKRPRRAARRG